MMTSEDYLWYSKAVLLAIATLTCIGIFLRWKTELPVCRTLAYMSLLLALICIIDIVVCQEFVYHPLMLKSGGSFGGVFLVLIVIAFSYLYAIEFFNPVKITFKLLLRLNLMLIISLAGYILFSVFKMDFLSDPALRSTFRGLNSDGLSVWWLLTTVFMLAYAIFVNVKTLRWTIGKIGDAKHNHPDVLHLRDYGLLIPYTLFSLAIVLLCALSVFSFPTEVEAACFIAVAVILFFIYIYSYFHCEAALVQPVGNDVEPQEQPINSALPEKHQIRMNDRLLIEKITRLMEQEEIYKSTELTTEVLAQRLGVSRKKLYLFLKEQYNSTFSDYVNGIRLECAERLMTGKEHIDLSIVQISELSGFNSVKTFNKFFKTKHATTPTKYRNSIEF